MSQPISQAALLLALTSGVIDHVYYQAGLANLNDKASNGVSGDSGAAAAAPADNGCLPHTFAHLGKALAFDLLATAN